MSLQLESIRQCVKLSALRKALLSLPKTLDETYNRILQHLESAGLLQDAVTALRWLCFSERPLSLLEIREVLAIKNGDNGGFIPDERLPDPTDIMVVCSSLISCSTMDDDDDNNNNNEDDSGGDDDTKQCRHTLVRLAHSSVKDYLLSDRCTVRSEFHKEACHREIAEACLHYLLHISENTPLTQDIVHQHPLARYAAEHWWQHAQQIDEIDKGSVVELASSLLTSESVTLLSWVQLYNVDEPWSDVKLSLTVNELAPPLYYAACIGVSEVVEKILQKSVDVNAHGRYGNALHAASVHGHEKVVGMLLIAGAKVNGDALEAASSHEYDHEKYLQMLHNAEAFHGNALHAASSHGHEKVVQMLLDAGVNINARGGRYNSALQAASVGGHEKVVQMLLYAGAEINAQGGRYNSALQAASFHGHEKVVQMLLYAGAEINAQGGRYNSALQAASFHGHEKVVQMLLYAGAEINAQGGRYNSALQAASFHGHEKVVQMLLDAGVKVNAQGGWYNNALRAASVQGHGKVVQMLLGAGANRNAQEGDFQHYISAPQAASVDDHPSVDDHEKMVENPVFEQS